MTMKGLILISTVVSLCQCPAPGSPPIHPGGDYFLESALPLIKPFISKAGASLIYKACWGQAKPKTYAGTDFVSMIEQIIQGTCQGIYLKKKL